MKNTFLTKLALSLKVFMNWIEPLSKKLYRNTRMRAVRRGVQGPYRSHTASRAKRRKEKKNERRPNLFPTDPTTQLISQVFLIISYAFVYFYK